ncbi:protein of unknown function (DUF928) [Rivularia sp. PCC 7116]|nr:protein of unknown function (DUF928) [Rivularia sp. PCC 7116]
MRYFERLITVIVITLTSFSCLHIPSLANGNQRNYDEPPPKTNGRSAGSRGCSNNELVSQNAPPALILLSPDSTQAKTVTKNPIFAWFVRDSQPRQIQFKLYKEDTAKQEYKLIKATQDKEFQSKPGIMVLTMPKNIVLTTGKKYLWQVELVCDRNRPSSNLFAEAELKVVPMQPKFKTELTRAVNQDQKAMLYAKNGLLYDALMAVLTRNKSSASQQSTMNKLKLSLLNKIALKPSELKKLQNSQIHLIEIK